MASDIPADAPAPRLCHLVKWPDFDGYGFNLHAEKAKTGQFIGKVDEGSPAEKAGLKEGDRIIEVNGVNIANENHRQVVERIKNMVNETKLLVLDEAADKWYKERKLVVKGTQVNVTYIKTPSSQSLTNVEDVQTHQPTNGSVKEEKKVQEVVKEPEHVKQSQIEESANGIKKIELESHSNKNGQSPPPSSKREVKDQKHSDIEPKGSPKAPKGSPKATKVENRNGSAPNGSGAIINNNNNSLISENQKKSNNPSVQSSTGATGKGEQKEDLNLNMSAAQMREMLANRKKRDPRKQNLDMKEKYQIVQQM